MYVMKFLVALSVVVLLLVPSEGGGDTCSVENGNNLVQYEGRSLNIKVPCKYNAVLQRCGPYLVTLTPAHRYLYPQYIMDSIWLSVKNAADDSTLWEGRTTNKIAALYIIKGGDRTPFNKKGGSMDTEALFQVSNTTRDVTLTENNNVFSVSFSPYDFHGNKHKDSGMVFVCNVDNVPTPYPQQFCGSSDGKEFRTRTQELFKNPKKVSQTIMYDIFTDDSIVQVQPGCQEATKVMTEQCTTQESRTEAIELCHYILDSDGHTQCVVKFACNPIDAFVNCVKYVCSDFKDKDACEQLGLSIDMCREFPGLTQQVKDANCYKDLLTAEDNPYYIAKQKKGKKNT